MNYVLRDSKGAKLKYSSAPIKRIETYHQIQHSEHGEGGVARKEGLPARTREGHERTVFTGIHSPSVRSSVFPS